MSGLNRYQRIVAEGYENGEFAHISSVEEAERVGDTLFGFLMAELSDSEDCDSRESAIGRLEVVAEEINTCLFLLQAEARKD
jgi:hypothetical protein